MNPIFSGKWSDEVKWKSYPLTELPLLNLCTAVFCLPLKNGKIMLIENRYRGWEMPGDHIETSDYNILDALNREVLEEARRR